VVRQFAKTEEKEMKIKSLFRKLKQVGHKREVELPNSRRANWKVTLGSK
jgi:hypothetical protein